MTGKTLAELDVKPGDVVRWINNNGSTHRIIKAEIIPKGGAFAGQLDVEMTDYGDGIFDEERFEIVSRATNPRIALEQLNAKPDTPVLWRDMTDAEKGALLLAHHEGKAIEDLCGGQWGMSTPVEWLDSIAYRIRPAEPREFWIVGGCEAWDNDAEAMNSLKAMRHSDIIHVREVMP